MIGAQIIGLAQTIGRLEMMQKKGEDVAEDIAMEAAEQIAHKAQGFAPVRTGYLRDHIGFRKITHGAEVYSEAYYSIFQELGTRKMPAHPFMKPACEAVHIEGVNIISLF